MMESYRMVSHRSSLISGCILWILLLHVPAFAYPVQVMDSTNNVLRVNQKPQRVVSMVPYITEMLVAFGQENALAGLSSQDMVLNSGLRKKNVGSYFAPNLKAIADCRPDLVIVAPSHRDVIKYFEKSGYRLLVMQVYKMEDAFNQMEMIGRLFQCETKAALEIKKNRDQLALVREKVARIPAEKRKRVVRVMAGETLMCPGDDSFQNEMIAAAGGIPPRWGKNGFAVSVTPTSWRKFNPQVVYGCNKNGKAVQALLEQEDWKNVAAVKNGYVTMFPCTLTCQVSTRVGSFVEWLAAYLYLETFADPEQAVLVNKILERTPLVLDMAYVKDAEIVKQRVTDAVYKTLLVRFKVPQNVVSTFEGHLSGVSAVGNTYIPMPASLGHMAYGAERANAGIRDNLGFSSGEFTTLMTGADMDNLAVKKAKFKDMEVTALVTAGVKGNAMRMSRDSGNYYKPGTINIILLTNRRLTANAMERAIITVTEAKSAALLDMDIRSSYTSLNHRATGTGTDNVMIVQGSGTLEASSGGHTKMGELIAKAVHAGVTEAIFRQNGLAADRNVFQRLENRRLNLREIVERYPVKMDKKELTAKLETLLMEPHYSSFLESAFAMSDDYGKGLIKDLFFFDTMCRSVRSAIAGKTVDISIDMTSPAILPPVMEKAFGALVTGIVEQEKRGIRK